MSHGPVWEHSPGSHGDLLLLLDSALHASWGVPKADWKPREGLQKAPSLGRSRGGGDAGKVWALLLCLPCRPESFSHEGTPRKPGHPWGPGEDPHLVEGDRKKPGSCDGAAGSHPGLRPWETSRPWEQCRVTEKPPPQAGGRSTRLT